MMRCLVTGATGFVGRALVTRLKASGAHVCGLARTPAPSDADETISLDLAEITADSHAFEGIDVVFHLAAKTHDMSEARGVDAIYDRTNVEGTRRVVEAAGRRGVRRLVFVSSVKAIDEGNRVPATEGTPERPLTPYGRSKLAAEALVTSAARTGTFESVCLRFPLVYGPQQRGNLQRMIDAVAHGRFPPPPANGNQRSMLHVANAVDALVLAATHRAASGRTYIVTDARPYATSDIYDAIRAALGRPPSRWHVPAWGFRAMAIAGDLARLAAGRRVGFDSDAFEKLLGSAAYDCRLIREELGYRPGPDLISELPRLVRERQPAP